MIMETFYCAICLVVLNGAIMTHKGLLVFQPIKLLCDICMIGIQVHLETVGSHLLHLQPFCCAEHINDVVCGCCLIGF